MKQKLKQPKEEVDKSKITCKEYNMLLLVTDRITRTEMMMMQ